MGKNFLWFVVGLAFLSLGAGIFFTLFEVVEDERYFSPSREAQVNDYLALDRWFRAEGYGVRVENTGNLETLKAAGEKTILIQTELFDWGENVLEYLAGWVEQGGSLILCLDYYWNLDTEAQPLGFLNTLGLEVEDDPEVSEYPYSPGTDFPSYSQNIQFRNPDNESALVFKDEAELIRLVQFARGKGKISVLGHPRFMTSRYLDSEPNARLSWFLLAGGHGSGGTGAAPGILFIRGEVLQEGIFGRIFQRGNFWGIIISALVLILAGFWSVIPVFGVVRENRESPGKALAERFLAEGRFLNRYRALDRYRAVYLREIRRKLVKKANLTDEEAVHQAAALLDSEAGNRGTTAAAPGRQTKKDFVSSIETLKIILERL